MGLRKMVGEHQDQQRWHGAVEVGNGLDPQSRDFTDQCWYQTMLKKLQVSHWGFPRIGVSWLIHAFRDMDSMRCDWEN